MTTPLTVDSLRAALHARGLRMTPQRQLILDTVAGFTGHISAEHVHQRVAAQYPDVHLSTVYRTLEVLEELGMLVHTHFHDGIARYHRVDEASHQHTVCRRCGREGEVSLAALKPLADELRRQNGFSLNLGHMVLVGYCRECAPADDGSAL